MKIFSTIFLFLLFGTASAQPDPLGDFNKHMLANWNGKYFQVGPYRVKGSPFLYGESFKGVVNYQGGAVEKTKKIFYDIYNQKAGVDVNGDLSEANIPVESFVLQLPQEFGGKALEFRSAASMGSSQKGFFAVLADGPKGSFLKYYKAILMADPSKEMDKQAKVFEQASEYFFYNKASGQVSKIKLREKDVMKELKNDRVAVDIVRTNELDLSKEYDMIRFINSYQ